MLWYGCKFTSPIQYSQCVCFSEWLASAVEPPLFVHSQVLGSRTEIALDTAEESYLVHCLPVPRPAPHSWHSCTCRLKLLLNKTAPLSWNNTSLTHEVAAADSSDLTLWPLQLACYVEDIYIPPLLPEGLTRIFTLWRLMEPLQPYCVSNSDL